MGKLHNIITFITYTAQRKQRFKKHPPHLLPRRDNATRWNSWYNMLDWSISKIYSAIVAFCAEEDELKDDLLTPADWRNLQAIRDFLQCFYDATKALEGRKVTLEHFLPSLEFLIHEFEKAIEQHAGNHFMLGCLDAGYSKLMKYFNKAERNPAYIAAVVLNPKIRWALFNQWSEKDRRRAREALFDLWRTEYRSNTGLP